MNLQDHPCFNAQSRHRFGRVHLPVAPRCNIQCKFCNRRFDCVNESRPGVTSAVLTPAQAMVYLETVTTRLDNIRVVGIAGPGDPFANAAETLETCRRVRARYPEMILCLATNGLNLAPYVDELAELNVSHVTVTVNAVDPGVCAGIYAWMRVGKRVLRAEAGARVLLERQLDAIAALKARGITVKINSIIIPWVNDLHIPEVARRMGELKVDLFNAMPYYPSPGSALEHLEEPSAAKVATIREAAEAFVPQMRHCTRCRADAVGLLGEAPAKGLMTTLQNCQHLEVLETGGAAVSSRPYLAVASLEGALVNQHLGEADRLLIYGEKQGRLGLIESRETPAPGGGRRRWAELAATLCDCRVILVNGAGEAPRSALNARGIDVIVCEGVIEEAVRAVFAGEDLRHMAVRPPRACGAGCGGSGMGCG